MPITIRFVSFTSVHSEIYSIKFVSGLYEVISFLQVLQFQHKSTKSVDHENEVKIILQMSGWHVPCMIIVWIKYGESRLYGNGKTYLIWIT